MEVCSAHFLPKPMRAGGPWRLGSNPLLQKRLVCPTCSKKVLCPVDLQGDSVAALDLAINIADRIDASLVLMNVVAIPPQAAELALEALTPYPVWERASRLKLEQIASERVPSRVRCETITRSGMPSPKSSVRYLKSKLTSL